MTLVATLDLFKALADDVRLRILHALLTSELSVAELVHILDLPQSTVSRHLKPLRDAGLVETRREGTSVYYRKGDVFEDADMFRLLNQRLRDLPSAVQDQVSLRKVLDQRKQRSRDFFEKIAGRYGSLTQPGGGWQALAAALAAGFAGQQVADLGCGEGELSLLLARFASSVTAVDQSQSMLREVRAVASAAGFENRIITEEGDLEDLPIGNETMDAVFLSQALHHSARPEQAVREAARIIRKNGKLVILDLVRHEQEWVRDEWADLWLGFDASEIRQWFDDNQLETLLLEQLPGSTPELAVLMAVGQKIS